jgi:hypothetical protein
MENEIKKHYNETWSIRGWPVNDSSDGYMKMDVCLYSTYVRMSDGSLNRIKDSCIYIGVLSDTMTDTQNAIGTGMLLSKNATIRLIQQLEHLVKIANPVIYK